LKELNTNNILKESLGIKAPVEQFLSKGAYYLVIFVGAVMALNQLGLSTIILYIILGIVLVIIVGLVVLAFKDFVPNVFASFWIHQKRLIEEGEDIEIKDVEGKVIEITLTETKIETKDKEIVLIPNSLLLKEKIKKKKK
jgi:MscS family membrane protein